MGGITYLEVMSIMERKALHEAEQKLIADQARAPRLPYRRLWQGELAQVWGEEQAGSFMADAEDSYKHLYANRPVYDHQALHYHLVNYILPALALYFSLRTQGCDKEAALTLVGRLFRSAMSATRRKLAFLGRFRAIYSLIRFLTPRFMRANFPPEGFEVEWQEISSQSITFNIHTCFYLDVFNKYDAPELTAVFCDLDDYVYDDVSPHFRWMRTQTLGRGDTICDFRFINTHS